MWPLLLASAGDPGARAALTATEVPGLMIGANRGLLSYAAAILAGRDGNATGADELARRADAYLARFPVWGDLARLCAADAAPRRRVGATRALADRRPGHLQRSWVHRAGAPVPVRGRRSRRGPVTGRETQVLNLLVQGLTNKEIARRLQLSPRTVDKHVESLLRKSGTRPASSWPAGPEWGNFVAAAIGCDHRCQQYRRGPGSAPVPLEGVR